MFPISKDSFDLETAHLDHQGYLYVTSSSDFDLEQDLPSSSYFKLHLEFLFL